MARIYEDVDELAAAIRQARRRAELTQSQLATALGVSGGTVKRWERGEASSLGSTPQRRYATAILVAEVTGERTLLGLEAPDEEQISAEIDAVRLRLAEVEARLDALEAGSLPRRRPDRGRQAPDR